MSKWKWWQARTGEEREEEERERNPLMSATECELDGLIREVCHAGEEIAEPSGEDAAGSASVS